MTWFARTGMIIAMAILTAFALRGPGISGRYDAKVLVGCAVLIMACGVVISA